MADEALGADLIGHGIRSVLVAGLVDCLRAHQLPLDVSPTSNLCTRSVPSLQDHPLPRMLDAGSLITLNSDDPTMFGTDLTGEYRTAAAMGLGAAALAELAHNGVRASFLEPARKPRCSPRSMPLGPGRRSTGDRERRPAVTTS